VLATCYATGANLFLGAFGAGISVATFGPSFTESFRGFGELVTELLKLGALLLFGAGAQYAFISFGDALSEDTGNAEDALADLDHRAHTTSMCRCGSGGIRSQSPLRIRSDDTLLRNRER
jgi:hypothetical protein